MATTVPATLHLERGARGYVLRTWGEYRGRVTIQDPGISADLTIHERLPDGGVGEKVAAVATAGGLSFEIQGGRVYALAGKRQHRPVYEYPARQRRRLFN